MNWEAPKKGWWVGTLGGKPAFTDGGALFLGVPEGKARVLQPPTAMEKGIQKCLANKMPLAKVIRMEPVFYPQFPCVVLTGEIWIQEIYYEYACKFFKGVKFYLGERVEADRVVICKVGDRLVGAIMPVRTPNLRL